MLRRREVVGTSEIFLVFGFRADDVVIDIVVVVLFAASLFLTFAFVDGFVGGVRVTSNAAPLVGVRKGIVVGVDRSVFGITGPLAFLGVRGRRDGGVTCGRLALDAGVDGVGNGARRREMVLLFDRDGGDIGQSVKMMLFGGSLLKGGDTR